MAEENQSLTIYRFRVALLRTSPHVWRRILVRPCTSLVELHRTVACAFGWPVTDPYRFLIRGRCFAVSAPSTELSPSLSEFQFRPAERFLYDLRFHDASLLTPVWRHQVRLEKILPAEPAAAYPRCTEGKGSPPLDQVSNPVELADLAELFTPRYIVHRLAELVDHNADDMRIARELRHLRPWLDRDRFRLQEANRRLQQMGVRP